MNVCPDCVEEDCNKAGRGHSDFSCHKLPRKKNLRTRTILSLNIVLPALFNILREALQDKVEAGGSDDGCAEGG